MTFVERDLDEFLEGNADLRADLITCVGVLHHLDQNGLTEFLGAVFKVLSPNGQLVIAEPIHAESVPHIVHSRNSRSILVDRLKECMPPDTTDPEEEPLNESNLLKAVIDVGFQIRKQTKGFELFHTSDPPSRFEKLIIKFIYWRYRNRGDVVALLLEKSIAGNSPWRKNAELWGPAPK